MKDSTRRRCRVGDLCFIIRAVRPENVGKIVRILRVHRAVTEAEGALHWWCRSAGGPLPGSLRVTGELVSATEGACADANLLPIRPGDSALAEGLATSRSMPERRPKRAAAPKRSKMPA